MLKTFSSAIRFAGSVVYTWMFIGTFWNTKEPSTEDISTILHILQLFFFSIAFQVDYETSQTGLEQR